MPDFPYWWWYELDGALPDRIKCANCDRRVIESDLSRDGLCPICVGRAKDDAAELRAEAGRRP